MEPVSNFRTLQPQYMAFAGITGAQLIRWYESRQFCGRVSWEKLTEYHMEPVSNFRTLQPQYMAFAGITGAQLIRWYESRQFCGRCGAKMVHDGKERMMRCETCGLMEYPKICPAVIVGLTDGNRILMSRNA